VKYFVIILLSFSFAFAVLHQRIEQQISLAAGRK
jgi:hypothetical protein